MGATVVEGETDEGGRGLRIHDRRAFAHQVGQEEQALRAIGHVASQAIEVGVWVLRLQAQTVAQPAQRESG